MDKYGVLLEGLDIERIGKPVTVTIVLSYIVRKLVIAWTVTRSIDRPITSIFMFNFTT